MPRTASRSPLELAAEAHAALEAYNLAAIPLPPIGTAGDRWRAAFDGPGLWLDPHDSQAVVENRLDQDAYLAGILDRYVPAPDWLAVKFGGDWGGLWGDPGRWGELTRAWLGGPVVPYLYVLPDTAPELWDIIGGLFHDGYPAVIVDAEMEWIGRESELRAFLESLNLADNLVGLAGYAWFTGWPDKGLAFGGAVANLDLVYLPMAYQSDLPTTVNAANYVETELARVVPRHPRSYVVDDLGLSSGLGTSGIGLSVWYAGGVEQSVWRSRLG